MDEQARIRINNASIQTDEFKVVLRRNPTDHMAKAELERFCKILSHPDAIALQNGWKV
jgi:hypothetical protein